MGQLPSKVEFASYLQYSPRGTGGQSVLSREVTYAIKQDRFLPQVGAQAIPFIVGRIKQRYSQYPFLAKFLGPHVILVPGPRSSPLPKGALWPSLKICEALIAEGLGGSIETCLERVQPVTRSSTAAPGGRPGPEDHYDSSVVRSQLSFPSGQSITLVDDVVTRGASFVGLTGRLEEAFPGLVVRSFALVRTMSYGDVQAVLDPAEGSVTFTGGVLRRQP